jgi:DNA polymerase III alpha subunit (gram-positive type)
MKSSTIKIKKNIVDECLYPPDYFLKKLGNKLKDTAQDVVKLAPGLVSPALAAFKPVKKDELKTSIGKVANVVSSTSGKAGGAVIATVVPAKAIAQKKLDNQTAAIDAKLKKSGEPNLVIADKNTTDLMPKVDVVSSVAGIKGTPVINNNTDMNLRDIVKNVGENIPDTLKNALKDQGNQIINKGLGRLTPAQQNLVKQSVNPALLPKTKALKDAEAMLTTPTETKSGKGSMASVLPSGNVSMIIVVVIIAALAFLYFKRK